MATRSHNPMRRDAVLRGLIYVRMFCNGSLALRRGLEMIVGIVKGCRDGFAALQGVSVMAPFYGKHCKIFRKLLSGTRG